MNNNLQSMLINLSAAYPSITRLIFAMAFLMGLSMTVSALYKLKVYGEMRTMMASQTNLKEPMMMLLVAAVFMYLPSALDSMLISTYGTSLDQLKPLAYITNDASEFQQGYVALLGLIRIVGLISFIRGWHLIASASQQGRAGQGFGKGLTHILGGLLALNIVGTKEILWNTFGFS
jgi:intracellular multiplication protein IcmC